MDRFFRVNPVAHFLPLSFPHRHTRASFIVSCSFQHPRSAIAILIDHGYVSVSVSVYICVVNVSV